MEKVEFGSEAWLEAASRVLAEVVAAAGSGIAGQTMVVGEVFTNAPAHLRQGGSSEIAWWFSIDGAKAQVAKGVPANADFSLRADYEAALPGAKAILGVTPEAMSARAQARQEAVASGRVAAIGSLDGASLQMRRVLVDFHNQLARVTA